MLVDGGSFAMHILHSGTNYFVNGVFKNPVHGVGILPLSRILTAARREERCQNACLCLAPALGTRNSPSCEIIDCPSGNARLGQRQASFEESTSRWREEVNWEALEAPHEKAPGLGMGKQRESAKIRL